MNAGDIAALALMAPAVLAAGPLAVRMAKEQRESAAVLRMLAQERAAREQDAEAFVPGPPPGADQPTPTEDTAEHLASVITLRRAA